MNNNTPILGTNSEPPRSPGADGPSTEQVLTHLEIVLKSEVFSGAARQQRLLRHLVTRRLQGATGELKEYTLGVEVFDRGDDFDPRLDPIVRVEASRLRSRLQKYYEGSGSEDVVRITLPRGAYLPSFASLDQAAAPSPDSAVLQVDAEKSHVPLAQAELPRRGKAFGNPVLVGISVAAAAALLAVWFFHKPRTVPAPPDFVNFKRVTGDGMLCASPTFSPDAKSLVYARREAGKWDLYRQNLGDLVYTNLTQGSGTNNGQPAWSPDGKRIAFRSERDGGGIFLLDPSGRNVSRLTNFGYYPSWSPDSTQIVFSTGRFSDPAETPAGAPSSLKIVNLQTRQVRALKAADSDHDALQPAWSPHGKRVAFWGMDRNGDRDLWTVAAEASGNGASSAVAVTHDSWTDWSPAWSPDGQYLYFSSDRGGAMNLWRVRIEEETGEVLSHPEPVTTPSSYSGWTAFAPNGKEFAYVHRLVSSQLYKAPFSVNKGIGFNQKVELTAGERSVREPEMSPDGNWIVVRVQDPQEDLALIRPDGSDLHRITNDTFSDRSPHWSPDGKQIVFLSNRSGRFELWSIHLDGSGRRQITKNGSMYSAWSPDGTLVGYPADSKPVALDPPGRALPDWGLPSIFRPISWSPNRESVVGRMRSNSFGQGSLFIVTSSAGDYWEIAPNTPYPSTVWLTGGKSLLFSRDGGIFLADLRTHQLHQEASADSAGLAGDMHSRFTLSRDDQSVFFVLSEDEEDIWIGAE
ncbi:MAG: hypothetical protein M3Y57_19930 [Acidobacteriota bacterium]|nr:hypothetical protein [Acidobacteriota bacterium]